MLFLIVLLIIGFARASNINIKISNVSTSDEIEYWALLVAVGVYADHPEENRPAMLREVENLHELLLVSEHWKEDHIKVIKGENGTVRNIVKGLRWLDKMEDKDDFSLVYITTHGFPLRFDIPPIDEDDNCDEALVSYWGFKYPWSIIWDDLLNLLLSVLNSKGVCVVIDSCYSGGFNDPPYFSHFLKNNRMTYSEWMHEFAEELSGRGRVVLMSCRENELSYGSRFTKLLIESLRGNADDNEDGMCSAEEAYQYVKDNIVGSTMHPTIFDNFQGELPLTEVEFPPNVPEPPMGQIIGETNTIYNYSTVSTDPEGHRIKYGWDLDSDHIVDEWSDLLDSGSWDNISLSWSIEGTYNIKVKAVDELGVESEWSNQTVVSMASDHIPDQRQTEMQGGFYMGNYWIAQSFIPKLSTLSKVELGISSWGSGDPTPIYLYIRDDLSGENLAECSHSIPYFGSDKTVWSTFDFEDLDVIPGNTYYIVCEETGHGWGYKWNIGTLYTPGNLFCFEPVSGWESYPVDGSFVTWGKI